MRRWSKLVRNVGWSGALRITLVVVLFAGVGGIVLAILGSPWPLVGLLIGLAVPTALRRQLIVHLDRSVFVMRAFGWGLIPLGIAFSFVRDRVPEDAAPEVLAGVAAVFGLYASVYFWVWSDPEVVWVER